MLVIPILSQLVYHQEKHYQVLYYMYNRNCYEHFFCINFNIYCLAYELFIGSLNRAIADFLRPQVTPEYLHVRHQTTASSCRTFSTKIARNKKQVVKIYLPHANLKVSFCFVSGAPSIRKFHVLRDRRHVITKDSEDKVTVWDILKVRIFSFSSVLCIFCFVLFPYQYHLQVANILLLMIFLFMSSDW